MAEGGEHEEHLNLQDKTLRALGRGSWTGDSVIPAHSFIWGCPSGERREATGLQQCPGRAQAQSCADVELTGRGLVPVLWDAGPVRNCQAVGHSWLSSQKCALWPQQGSWLHGAMLRCQLGQKPL